MKKIVFNLSAILFAGLLMFSCEKWIDPEINVNPNSPTDVPLALLLPATQGAMFYSFGGDHSRAPSIWVQHQSGVDRQAYAFDRFQYNESDINNLWNTLNANAMKNLYAMRQKSAESNSPHYAAVSNILTALTLGELTDVWGDIPFYQAHRGEQGNLTPAYDSQQVIYGVIDSLLTAASAQITAAESVFTPTAVADLIYKGDKPTWERLAWTLRLRYQLHLSKRNGYNNALALLNNANAKFFTSNADDFQFKFGTAANARSPRFNFNSNRGDIRAGKYLVDLMKATGDPRLPVYFIPDTNSDFTGSAPAGQLIAASWMGDFYGAQDANVPVVTYGEYLFMRAEILFNTGNTEGAATAYNDAVKASLARHGVTNATWEADNASETGVSITQEKIMMGKYVALYLQTEVYHDYRRTGYPNNLPAPADAVLNAIPRRIPYPLDERLYNGNNMPAGQTMSSRVWWDVQ